MQFNSFDEIVQMGGHGAFVWSAYAIAAITLIALVVLPLLRQRRFFAEQFASERRRAARAHQVFDTSIS
jgi:heme exporter protein D